MMVRAVLSVFGVGSGSRTSVILVERCKASTERHCRRRSFFLDRAMRRAHVFICVPLLRTFKCTDLHFFLKQFPAEQKQSLMVMALM